MADPKEAGTPQAETPVSEKAGTGVAAAEVSEQPGKPVDHALAMTWKQKAEQFNAVDARRQELEARIAQLEQQRYASAQPATDPLSQMVGSLRERQSFGDTDASEKLAVLQIAAAQQAEQALFKAMVKAHVSEGDWDVVESLIRQSGYQMPVESAKQLARGREAPALADQLKAKDEEIRKLREAIDGRTAGNGAGRANVATTPASATADGGQQPTEMTLEAYQAIMARGGAEARALRDSGVRLRPAG